MKLSEKIKEIRLLGDLSQKQFGETLGYSQRYISDIETERAKPSTKILEAIASKFSVSLDWLFLDNKLLDLIEINKNYRNKDLICLYAFTQEELDRGEQMLKDLLGQRGYIFIDAANKSSPQVIREMVGGAGESWVLWEKLESTLLREEIIVVIKNLSKSKMPYKAEGGIARTIFKTLYDASPFIEATPKSILILLDFASYIEKIHERLGGYVVPIYIGEPRGLARIV